MLKVCDIVEYAMSDGEKRRWRVESFLKKVYLIEPKDEPIESVADEILNELFQVEYNKEWIQRVWRGKPVNARYRLMWCKPEEATHVSLYAVCGTIAPIDKVTQVSVVNWSPDKIDEEREKYDTFFLLGQYAQGIYWE